MNLHHNCVNGTIALCLWTEIAQSWMPLRCRLRFLFANLFYEQEATNDIYIWSGFAILNSVKTGLPDIFQDSF